MKKGEILDKVYKSNLTSRAKQIMFYLINRANAEGTCFPSVRTIASDCGVSERTVQRTMKILLKEGFVIKENRYRDNGGQSSNLYLLQIEPENNIKDDKCSEEKIYEEYSEISVEKNDNLEAMEDVTFDDYKEVFELKDNNFRIRKQNGINILVNRYMHIGNPIILQKCHPIIFHNKDRKFNSFKEVISSNSSCHGVDDKLYPP